MEVKEVSKNPLDLHYSYTAQWQEKKAALHRWDFADACVFDQEDFQNVTKLLLEFSDGRSDVLKYPTYDLANVPMDDFERDLRELASRPYGKPRELLQHVYNHWMESGEWPRTKSLVIRFRELGNIREMLEDIGPDWIRPGESHEKDAVCRVTLRSLMILEGADEYCTAFTQLLELYVHYYIDTEGEPEDREVRVVAQEVGIPEDIAQRIGSFLYHEAHFSDTSGRSPDGVYTFKPSEEVLNYEHVQTLQEYFRAYDDLRETRRTASRMRKAVNNLMDSAKTRFGTSLEEYTGTQTRGETSGVGTLEGYEGFSQREDTERTEEHPNDRSPKVFISYKWENKERLAWVDQFYKDLRTKHGIDAYLDPYEVDYGDSFSDYMQSKIGKECDVLLFIITPASVKAVDEGEGGAVKFEMQLANARRLAEPGFRIIGIYREGDANTNYLRDHRYADFREGVDYEKVLRSLADSLWGRMSKPPLATQDDVAENSTRPRDIEMINALEAYKRAQAHIQQVGSEHDIVVDVRQSEFNNLVVRPSKSLPGPTKRRMMEIAEEFNHSIAFLEPTPQNPIQVTPQGIHLDAQALANQTEQAIQEIETHLRQAGLDHSVEVREMNEIHIPIANVANELRQEMESIAQRVGYWISYSD